ncbi:MAG: helicase HerA domain-containing protein, partial [Chloroflexota bacterium]
GVGRPGDPDEWRHAMPHVLTACHETGHALVMALHGEGDRHRLYVGGRRIVGAGGRSSEAYLEGQESAFKAYFSGLELGPVRGLDGADLPGLANLLRTAPALGAVTGIPSGRGSRFPSPFQSLDRLVRAVGDQKYALVVVAEPLEPWKIDRILDACRELRDAVHGHVRRTVSRSRGESENVARPGDDGRSGGRVDLPIGLFGLAAFCQVAGIVVPGLLSVGQAVESMGYMANTRSIRADAHNQSQVSAGTNSGESGSVEVLNASAEECERLLQEHIARLQTGKSAGWWQTAIYIAAESEDALHRVSSALRSVASGDNSSLDPIRVVASPEYATREAIERGQVLDLLPAGADQRHPLGAPYDVLGTCVHSDELAVLVNLPQHEIPGLPMRDLTDFAVSVPPEPTGAIRLGTLRDGLGRDLGPVAVGAEALNRHVFVTGMTGYGKTNSCKRILLEAYDRLGVPFLVLEPAKAEYKYLADRPELRHRLRVFSVGGGSGLPLRLNPL